MCCVTYCLFLTENDSRVAKLYGSELLNVFMKSAKMEICLFNLYMCFTCLCGNSQQGIQIWIQKVSDWIGSLKILNNFVNLSYLELLEVEFGDVHERKNVDKMSDVKLFCWTILEFTNRSMR